MIKDLKYKQFKNYLIYEDGTVISLLTGKHIKKRIGSRGYYLINLCINSKCKTFTLHKLVASCFIENPDNLPCINHIDGNKLNNNLSNLEWVTYSDNTKHAIRTGLFHHAKGKNTKYGRFSEEDIINIRNLNKQGKSQYQIASLYNVSRGAIQQILERKSYSWIA